MGRRSPRPRPGRLAEKLRAVRLGLELSQEQMAEALTGKDSPVHAGNISRFERGEREPSLLVILRYAQMAGVSTDVLINDDLELPKRLPTSTVRRVTHARRR
jgi:transcriptional regulator with XRE-family HTH domain